MDTQKYQVNLEVRNLDRQAALRVRDFLLREMENAGQKNNTTIELKPNTNP